MPCPGTVVRRLRRCLVLLASVGMVTAVMQSGSEADAAPKKTGPKVIKIPQSKPEATPPPRTSLLNNDAWARAPLAPITAADIDALVLKELKDSKIEPAPRITDEQFIRRATLDLVGQLPSPAEITAFVKDTDSRKRARLIDKLLDSDAFAQHWARYWRDVIAAKTTDRRALLLARAFEDWLAQQLKANKNWAEITRAMITAEGSFRYGPDAMKEGANKDGAAFFLLSHLGADAANDRAAETSRVFLGIQIRCAQCHDHPFDQWKQVQFHELAAYYARTKERPVRDMDKKKVVGIELFAAPKGEHEMAMKNDPNKMFVTHPRFLDGKGPTTKDMSDKERRAALASSVVDKNNYWFAGAFTNRVWGELMGQSFYQPVDDMGPGREAVFAPVLARLSSAFRATNYDIKGLYRVIMNTEAYARQSRPGESTDQHLHFAASNPKQIRPDALLDSLMKAVGPFGGAGPVADKLRPLAARFGFAADFVRLFEFDPSLKADEVEGNIAQALMLMNNPQINGRISAKGDTPLAKLLVEYPKDEPAIEALYLRTLARKPTGREIEKAKAYISKVGNRSEAFEDLLWVLVNSTEFQTKR